MRILYIGTGEIGLPALRSLLDNPAHEVCAVICQPDKPVGRKQVLTPPATKVLAMEHDVTVYQPRRIRTEALRVADLQPEIAVVMAYGQILPRSVLDVPPHGCLNLHASLLPKHRGAAPIQASILAGDAESGITVMYMDEGLDTGDILLTETIALAPDETGGSLHDRLALLAPVALARALELIAAGAAPRTPQDATSATHTGKLERANGVLSWEEPAENIARRIRAFDPWPGTSTTLPDGSTVKIYPPVEALELSSGCAPAGSVVSAGSDGLTVACGTGVVRLHQLQAEGRKRLEAAAFLAGRPLVPGDRLGFAQAGIKLP
ncbi:MAG TPA: methionyl-tRNA formyltransferase [Verrucomicrobiales bacterium]|jgi:methionyl-tRNA formyltransferase|nr:methionyl-tRNA formyltransferase [Verrucomicrobiales bacterium]